MREKKPSITIEDLTSDERLREIEKTLDDHLEKVFSELGPEIYTEYEAARRADYERKNNDKSWLLDHWKDNSKKYFKMGRQKNRELRFKKHLTVK